jgi:hypothetical protein
MLECPPWKEQPQQVTAQVQDQKMVQLCVVQDQAMGQLCVVQDLMMVRLSANRARSRHLLGVLSCGKLWHCGKLWRR